MSKSLVTATWDEVPHLTQEQKDELWESIPPHERESRAKGIPSIGSGAIYPVAPDKYECDPIELPNFWPRAYGLDVGWKKTAAVWGAFDPESDTVYIYSEHYQGQAEPQIHADAIQGRGEWIAGAIDPASAGSSQVDGRKLMDEYMQLGLNLVPADNAVEAGIHAVYRRLSAGKLKIFRTCAATLAELRLYHRDENGKVVKENDHAMDALRYLIMTGLVHATKPPVDDFEDWSFRNRTGQSGRSSRTGY